VPAILYHRHWRTIWCNRRRWRTRCQGRSRYVRRYDQRPLDNGGDGELRWRRRSFRISPGNVYGSVPDMAPSLLSMMQQNRVPRRGWRAIANGLAAMTFVLLGASTYLWYSYAATRPHDARPSEGCVYVLNTHGSFVYLTIREQLRLTGLITSAFLCGGASMAIYTFVVRR
jgi:hypothetical protein